MSRRDTILERIRTTLAGEPDVPPPPVPELWPPGTWTPPGDLAGRFLEELVRVDGEGFCCVSIASAQQQLCALVSQPDWVKIGVVDHPLCRAAVAGIDPDRLVWVEDGCDRQHLAELPVGLMPAQFLLADTGTAVVTARSATERLLCYLPHTAVLLAERDNLVAHMSDMWDRLTSWSADPALRGEIVLVTGPSRTADIEKQIVLGAHGPKRLIVLIVAETRAALRQVPRAGGKQAVGELTAEGLGVGY